MLQANKQTKLLAEYIAKVKEGKHAMILGADYVVMSRNMYDEMMAKYEKYEGGNSLDCLDDAVDIDKDWDNIMTEAHEQDERDFPKGR